MYKTISFPVVLYGCDTWPLILREHRPAGIWEQGTEEDIWTEEAWFITVE
jgi:hypothetical protein